MIVGFSKLFADIIHSTVWREPMHVKVVWITMLAMADRHGQVFASLPGLADSAKVTLDECIEALEVFSSPDKYSRTKDYEGRRIVEIDGGWLLLNYEKFRDRRDDEEQRIQTRDRVRRHRERARALSNDVTESVTATQSNDIQKQIQKQKAKEEDICRIVFDAWSQTLGHPRARFDKKRRSRIHARLDDGFTVEDLKLVPHGVKKSPWHMGENPTHTRYDDIATVYRDADQVEKFLALARNGDTDYAEGCDICRNHPDRSQVSLKTYGWIFNTKTKQLEDCICKNGTAQRQG